VIESSIITKLQAMAGSSPCREICGLIDSAGEVYPILNVAINSGDFTFSRAGYGRALSKINHVQRAVQCVYHSHLNGDARPSDADLLAIRRTGFDYLIVANNTHTYTRSTDV